MEKVVKTADKKATEVKKPLTKRNINKGQALACEVCGISVTIEEIGGMVVEEDNVLICCGKPMKDKTTIKNAVKK